MKLHKELKDMINKAKHKVLATCGSEGVNVIPVSMVMTEGEKLVICDCFMDKTRKNVQSDSKVALAFWDGMEGVQIKGTAAYEKEGDCFEKYKAWLKDVHPDRELCGVLVITPSIAYDLAPGRGGVISPED